MQYTTEATTFPCQHEFEMHSKSGKRCVTCKMPIVEEAFYHDFMDTEILFCCFECKKHYIEVIDETGII